MTGRSIPPIIRCHESLHFVVLSPDYTLSTHKARAALPSSVSFADAVFDLSHLAMLPHAVALGDEEMISICLSDKLHQPYRLPLIPGSGDVRRIAEGLAARLSASAARGRAFSA